MTDEENVRDGYIVDYISGREVKAKPEEVNAVQVFSKQLVEDYGYKKSQIQTRPQFKVRARPSDTSGRFPVDIAVFKSDNKTDNEVYIIVECKAPSKKKGRIQLEDYLRFSKAKLGGWFNGEERFFLRKYEKDGEIIFDEIPNIPMNGQRLEDIGKFKRKHLKSTHNLKSIFSSIRNHLAGNAVGTTRDEVLAKQLINLILCKLFDEKFTKPEDMVQFRAGIDEENSQIAERIKKRFNETKETYADILDEDEKISLDDASIAYIVGELQNYCLMEVERDVVSDAFEVFISKALKGGNGQFFTPKNVVKTVVEIIDPDINDKIIDPACGSGGFLIESLKYLHEKIEVQGREFNWSTEEINREKIEKANKNLKGIEKDDFLTKIAKAYMILVGDGKGGIFCEDSLVKPETWKTKTQNDIKLGSFDIVLTNPPFGSKIAVKGMEKLEQFEFGHKWKKNKKTGIWEKGKLQDKVPPQILFVERCLELLKDGGKMAIVLPDGILSNPSQGYIMQYLLENSEIIGVIDLPMNTFLPYTPTKTHVLFVKKTKEPRDSYDFFMSYAKTCGHDKQSHEIYDDEIKLIPGALKKINNEGFNHLAFPMNTNDIKNKILLPKYYNPDLENTLKEYEDSGKYILKSFKELEDEGVIKISGGHEVGSKFYGTGDIPFIRTSEISNWEIISDPTHCVSEEVYEEYKDKQNIQPEDILVIKDGTYLMGRAAMITDLDLKIVIQSHFKKITVLKKDILSPYVLLGLIGLDIVQRQIESKTFRQGTISTLGNRLYEVYLPIMTDKDKINEMDKKIREIITLKRNAKEYAQNFELYEKTENLMGIKNKAKLGNLS